MAKKFVTICVNTKKFKMSTKDLKGLHQLPKRKLPPLPSY